jgi:hypothetical protein
VLALIETKARGEELPAPDELDTPEDGTDLSAALEASLAGSR